MKRKPLGYRPINPMITTIFLDSCAFDPKYSPENEASLRIFELSRIGEIILNIAHSNQKEVEHPNTPIWVKKLANNFIYTIETCLNEDERRRKSEILRILTGRGKPEKMTKDADHVFEADKYGSYFVTTDKRILKKKKELQDIVSVNILKPSELLEIIASYEKRIS